MKVFILIYILLFLNSCVSGSNQEMPRQTEGWVDNNTYRVMSVGFARRGMVDKVRRRFYARESALILAQRMVVEHFTDVSVSGSTTIKNGRVAIIIILKKFSGVITGGNIIYEAYDDNDNCRMIYEVYNPGLKESVLEGI